MANPKNKKPTGLGRGFESLLEDNSPLISSKPTVVCRGDAEDEALRRRQSDDLYRKDGVRSYVKTPKRSGS